MKTCYACGEINGNNRTKCFKCGRSLASRFGDEVSEAPRAPSASPAKGALIALLVVVAIAAIVALSGVFSTKSSEEQIAEAGSRIRIDTAAINDALESAGRLTERIADEQEAADQIMSDFVSDFNDLHNSIVDDLMQQ